MPGAAWNVSVVQSLNFPASSTIVASPTVTLAQRLAARSRTIVIGMRSGGCPTTNGFSGPSIAVSMRSWRISIGTLMPPSLKRAPDRRVVNRRKVPCVPSRSGHAHRAQLGSVEAVRRKRHRHPQDRAPDAVLAQDRPERLRFSQVAKLGTLTRNQVAADPEERVRPCRHAPTTRRGRYVLDRDRGNRRCCGAPGCVPVLKDDHATGDTAGKVVRSRR